MVSPSVSGTAPLGLHRAEAHALEPRRDSSDGDDPDGDVLCSRELTLPLGEHRRPRLAEARTAPSSDQRAQPEAVDGSVATPCRIDHLSALARILDLGNRRVHADAGEQIAADDCGQPDVMKANGPRC